MNDFSVIIPARYGSTRLPAKALADIAGKPLVWHVAQRALDSNASEVIIATDDQRIMDAVKDIECEAAMTSADHQSGSDRLAEVVTVKAMAADHIVVNVQGDEPTIPPRLINEVAQKLADNPEAVMATAAKEIDQMDDIENPNVVKVYNEYHKDGLEIIGVSLDGQGRQRNPKQAWLDAIEKDGLTWHQVSNLKYFNDPVAQLYNIESIPATFILDQEGKIVAKNLRGKALELKVKELLGK